MFTPTNRDLLSYVTELGESWDDTHKSRSVIKFVMRPMSNEIVPFRLLARRGVFVVFLPVGLHVKCGREVSFGCCVIPVCLLVHDTRICCIKALTLLRAEFQSDLFLSSTCCAEHI